MLAARITIITWLFVVLGPSGLSTRLCASVCNPDFSSSRSLVIIPYVCVHVKNLGFELPYSARAIRHLLGTGPDSLLV